jgi:two-component system response regulator DesR
MPTRGKAEMTTPKPSQRIGLLCVDDNPLVAEALRIKFRPEADIEWLGHHHSADNLAALVRDREPDIVLLDLDMPGRDALEAMKEITQAGLDVRVIVLSGYVSLELINRAIAAGAWGYVSKSDGELAVLDAVRRVAADEFVLSTEVLTKVSPPTSG